MYKLSKFIVSNLTIIVLIRIITPLCYNF